MYVSSIDHSFAPTTIETTLIPTTDCVVINFFNFKKCKLWLKFITGHVACIWKQYVKVNGLLLVLFFNNLLKIEEQQTKNNKTVILPFLKPQMLLSIFKWSWTQICRSILDKIEIRSQLSQNAEISRISLDMINFNHLKSFRHLTHSPNLKPYDFHLFLQLKEFFRIRHSTNEVNQ